MRTDPRQAAGPAERPGPPATAPSPSSALSHPPAASLPWCLGVAVAACALTLMGWRLAALQGPSQAIGWFWPAAGLVWAATLRAGRWGAAAGAAGTAAGHLLAGQSPGLAVALVIGPALSALACARWLQLQGFDRRLERPRDLALASGAAVLGQAVGVAADTTQELAVGRSVGAVALPQVAWRVWQGEALGLLVLGLPLLHGWPGLGRGTQRRATWRRLWPPGLALLACVGLSVLAPLMPTGPASAWAPAAQLMAVLLLPAIVWRCGIGLGMAALAGTGMAWWVGTLMGWGPVSGWTAREATDVAVLVSTTGLPLDLAAALPWQLEDGLPWLYTLSAVCAAAVLMAQAQLAGLTRREARWRHAVQGLGLAVADWDLRTGAVYQSARWQSLTHDPAQPDQAPASLASFVGGLHASDRQALQTLLDASATDAQWRRDVRLRLRDQWQWFDLQLTVAERNRQGQPLRVIATLDDIAQRQKDRARLALTGNVFQRMQEGLAITDGQFRVLDANPAYCRIVGVTREAALGTVPDLMQTDPVEGAARPARLKLPPDWRQRLALQGQWSGELVARQNDGGVRAAHATVSVVREADGETAYHVVMLGDVSEQAVQREQLARQANFDELTRLPNRARLAELMREALARTEQDGGLLVVGYLDLDRFQRINEQAGNAQGDRVLTTVADRLRQALRTRQGRPADQVARLGGDEFVLLLHANSTDEARAAVERVRQVVALPLPGPQGEGATTQAISASIGATIYPLDAHDADTLLRHAHHAMFGAKQSGRNAVAFFDPESNRRVRQRESERQRVRQALLQGELQPYYQPKVDLRSGRVIGVEALLRWHHPDKGVVAPAHFLPLIEHTELSAEVGDHVLGRAIDQLAEWQTQGVDLSISVNISGRHLQRPDFTERLAELLARHPQALGPKLELEVLETAALVDIAHTSAVMARCARLGVRWALDDFGTGYSTLTYLKQLPVQVLKIDRSFVQHLLVDEQDKAIVEGVLSLATTFGCTSVAEGIETPAQARALMDMGCAIGQGAGIASPMPPEAFGAWLRQWRGLFTLAAADPGREASNQNQQLPSHGASVYGLGQTDLPPAPGTAWPGPADPLA